MDAKAKVVICLVPERFPNFASVELQLHGGYEPKIGDALIPLTDHEAALAELWQRLEALDKDYAIAIRKLNEAWAQRDTLRSGLEALAGELETFAPKGELGPLHGAGMAFAYQDAAKAIRTLASSATGEKNTEEETGK